MLEEYKKRLEQALARQLKLTWNSRTERWDSLYSVSIVSMGLTRLPLKFGEIGGDFKCAWNQLTSLQGAPHTVDGSFDCQYNNLKNLIGAPDYISKNFYCGHNQLTSIEGLKDNSIGGYMYCNNNPFSLPRPRWLNLYKFIT